MSKVELENVAQNSIHTPTHNILRSRSGVNLTTTSDRPVTDGDIELGKFNQDFNNTNNPSRIYIADEDTVRNMGIQTEPLLAVFVLDKKGKKVMEEIIHYYTHFLLFVIFEILFYFHYVVNYERVLMYKMIKDEEQKILSLTDIDLTPYTSSKYYENLCTTLVDDRTNKSNTEIYENALYLIIGMSIIFIILIAIESGLFTQHSTCWNALGKSLLLMVFIGLFDFVFFSYFVMEYKVIDTAELVCYIYENAQ